MKQRFFTSTLFSIVLFLVLVVLGGPVLAINTSTSAGQRREQGVNREQLRAGQTARLQKMVDTRVRVFQSYLTKLEAVQAKINQRTAAMKQSGKDVSKIESSLAADQAKLAVIKQNIALAETANKAIASRADAVKLRDNLLNIRKQLVDVRNDYGKIISQLKSFNSATSSSVAK